MDETRKKGETMRKALVLIVVVALMLAGSPVLAQEEAPVDWQLRALNAEAQIAQMAERVLALEFQLNQSRAGDVSRLKVDAFKALTEYRESLDAEDEEE